METTEDRDDMLPLPKASTRKKIVYGILFFCAFLISYIIWKGDPNNSLHSSALAWAFSLSIFVVSGYLFGAVADRWIMLKR